MTEQIIKISPEEEINLDPARLQFTEATLNEFLKDFPSWYSYYSQVQSRAQLISSLYEDRYDQIYAEKFKFHKFEKASDKLAEASAKSDSDVIDALKQSRKAKQNLNYISGYLRALDKANQNALNLGYNIRKEMDKLGSNTIKSLEEIMGHPEN